MGNRIKGSLRSLDSFGVSGVLDPDATVYYTTLFSTRQIGRVSDLIIVRLNPILDNELKLRTLLVFGTFQAFRVQFINQPKEGGLTHTNESELEQPLLVEVGTDSSKLAISVCFDLKEGVEIDFRNISNRIYTSQPKNTFERLLVTLYSFCDHLLLRYQESTRRAEVVSIISNNSGFEIGGPIQKERPQIVMLSQFMLTQAPKPKAYVDLGDLDFAALLKEEGHVNGKVGLDSQGREGRAQKGRSRFSEDDPEENLHTKSAKDGEEIEEEEQASDTIRVKGSPQKELDSGNEVIKISGKDDPESKKRGGLTNMLGVSGKEGSSESEARKLILEIQAGRLERVVQRGDKDLPIFRKDISNPEAVKFIEGLVDEVRKAKEHLGETARKLDYSIPVRESSLKNENEALQKELKRKENNLLQKNQETIKMKQELVEANNQIEKLKRSKTAAIEGEGPKHKNIETDRSVMQLKEENRALTQRFEGVQAQLNSIQNSKNAALERLNEKLEAAKEKIGIFQKMEQGQKRLISKLLAEVKTLKKYAPEGKQNANPVQESQPNSAGESKQVAKPGLGQNVKKDTKKAS